MFFSLTILVSFVARLQVLRLHLLMLAWFDKVRGRRLLLLEVVAAIFGVQVRALLVGFLLCRHNCPEVTLSLWRASHDGSALVMEV